LSQNPMPPCTTKCFFRKTFKLYWNIEVLYTILMEIKRRFQNFCQKYQKLNFINKKNAIFSRITPQGPQMPPQYTWGIWVKTPDAPAHHAIHAPCHHINPGKRTRHIMHFFFVFTNYELTTHPISSLKWLAQFFVRWRWKVFMSQFEFR